MNNINIMYRDIPESIVAFYVQINNTQNIIVNTKFDGYIQGLGFFGCLYYLCTGSTVAKITTKDIAKEDFEPIIYAKEKLDCFFKEV